MLTAKQIARICAFIKTHKLAKGLGTEEEPCSIAAINLSLTGKLTDDIPSCMSQVVGTWIIRIQDEMPSDLRNAPEWKSALMKATGTGRSHEKERIAMILDWTRAVVLPQIQSIADKYGFGKEWRRMCEVRTDESAKEVQIYAANVAASAANAADGAVDGADANAAASAAHAVGCAAANAAANAPYAAYAVGGAAYAASAAANAAYAADNAAYAAYAADNVANAADGAAAARLQFWRAINPSKLLAELATSLEEE